MKKILSLYFFLFACVSLTYAQTTYEVGEGKEYAKITDAWADMKNAEGTEFIINVAEGTYVESDLAGISNKKVTIIGAGADKTTIMGKDVADFAIAENYQSPQVNCGMFFKLATTESDFELVCENITFRNFGSSRANWSAALIFSEGVDDAYTFKNCMFREVFARQGAIVSAVKQAGTRPIAFTMEDCFVENCGTYEFNHSSGMFVFAYGADLTIKNTTFMNNISHRYNLQVGANQGKDLGRKIGSIVNFAAAATVTYPSTVVIEDVNVIGSKMNAETTTANAMFRFSNLSSEKPTVSIKNLISIGNCRKETSDCDLNVGTSTLDLTVTSSFVNGVKDAADESDIETLAGVNIDKDLTYDSDGIKFEMDGELPKTFVNAKGVKYLKIAEPVSIERENEDIPFVSIIGNLLNVSNLKQDSSVSIYDITGKLIKSLSAGSTSVEVNLSEGVYILKIGSYTTKIKI